MRSLRLPPYVIAAIVTGAFLLGVGLAWYLYGDVISATLNSTQPLVTDSTKTAASTGDSTDNFRPTTDTTTTTPVASLAAPSTVRDRIRETQLDVQTAAQTSWQDAFDVTLWDLEGGQVSESGIRLSTGQTATFVRSYRRIMAEFSLKFSEEDESSLSDRQMHFQIRLIPETGDDYIAVHSTGARLLLLARTDGQTRTLRKVSFPERRPVGVIRVNATGNRLMVAWNNRLMINAPQPREILGQPFLIQVASTDAPLEVTSMRLEGE